MLFVPIPNVVWCTTLLFVPTPNVILFTTLLFEPIPVCDYLQHFYLSLNQMHYYLQLMYPGDENVSVSLFVNMASPINVSHGTKTVSTSLFFNTVRISDKKFTCAAVNHATSQFAHKKKLTAQWFGPVAGLPAVNWNSLTSLQFCPSKPCNLAVRFKKS